MSFPIFARKTHDRAKYSLAAESTRHTPCCPPSPTRLSWSDASLSDNPYKMRQVHTLIVAGVV
jgi:hypothetical protein